MQHFRAEHDHMDLIAEAWWKEWGRENTIFEIDDMRPGDFYRFGEKFN